MAVHSRTKSKAQALLDRGATWAASPAEAAAGAEVVFICVTDTPDVREVISGKRGILNSARPELVVVDHSTISPSATREMAAELARRGTVMLDAPVSGGDVGARNATLSIMVGGDKSAYERVLPLLKLMGKTTTHIGPSGAGQLTKLMNQILVSVTNLAVCEAITFAQKNGLDAQAALAAVSGGAAASWQLSNLGPKMLSADFAPGFMVDLQQKDLRLVLEAATEAGMSPQAVQLAHALFAKAQQNGWGREGTQALYKVVRG